MAKQYAIITFRDSGPMKTWAAVRGAQVHNSREKPIAHATADIAPEHLIGSGNLVADIQTRLIEHRIDPTNLRKNGVIAYEAVLTASPEFFESAAMKDDEYASAMEGFDLCRGEVKSARKHKPVKEYLADLKEREEAHEQRTTELQEMLAWVRDRMEATKQARAELAKERNAMDAMRAQLQAERHELAKNQRLFREDCAELDKRIDVFESVRGRALDFIGRVRKFPQEQWREETLVMARSAKSVVQAHREMEPAGGVAMQKAWLAQRAGVGR